MITTNAKKLILVGFLLLLVGVVLPFLMILEIVKASFLLSFIAHGASVSGLFLGTLGAFSYAQTNRK
jgi:hypothetical protein